jgi:phosphoenolpyruvate---glycerone phosphotransferase subunit DhaL
MDTIKQAHIIKWLEDLAPVFRENKEYLTELDSAIGDADHGFNMERGFNKVLEKVNEMSADDTISSIFKNTGMTLIAKVGGASGPLFGTFFLQAGAVVPSDKALTLKDFYTCIDNGLKGVKSRGRASKGEKTMIDALEPVVESLHTSVATHDTIEEALSKAAKEAEMGMKSTIGMLAQKGRASYLGERSIGHQDAGATSVYLIFKTLNEVITNFK